MRPIPAWMVLTLAAASAGAQVPQQPQTTISPAQDGGVREVLESIVIPPIPNAPFSATLATEWARPTPGGATITFVNERHLARAADGRIYEERWGLVPRGSTLKSQIQWIQIADAAQRTLYNCNMLTHVCGLLSYNPLHDLAAATSQPPVNGPLPAGRGTIQTEDLGTRILLNVDTHGRRVTRTLNPGVIGNDAPVTDVRETWRSESLALNLLSIRSGPLIGTQTFTITELDANPPDPALFEPPAGFQVRDLRATRAPSE